VSVLAVFIFSVMIVNSVFVRGYAKGITDGMGYIGCSGGKLTVKNIMFNIVDLVNSLINIDAACSLQSPEKKP
jgi:hypothetical protein